MHCICCDRILNDFESTRKDRYGEYMDMCNKCIAETYAAPVTSEREDFNPDEIPDEELEPIFDEWHNSDYDFDCDHVEDWED